VGPRMSSATPFERFRNKHWVTYEASTREIRLEWNDWGKWRGCSQRGPGQTRQCRPTVKLTFFGTWQPVRFPNHLDQANHRFEHESSRQARAVHLFLPSSVCKTCVRMAWAPRAIFNQPFMHVMHSLELCLGHESTAIQ
jgi:hypothetical protein